MCEWLVQVADSRRHLILQSGIFDKFFAVIQDAKYLTPTPKHPFVDGYLESMIRRLNGILNERNLYK